MMCFDKEPKLSRTSASSSTSERPRLRANWASAREQLIKPYSIMSQLLSPSGSRNINPHVGIGPPNVRLDHTCNSGTYYKPENEAASPGPQSVAPTDHSIR